MVIHVPPSVRSVTVVSAPRFNVSSNPPAFTGWNEESGISMRGYASGFGIVAFPRLHEAVADIMMRPAIAADATTGALIGAESFLWSGRSGHPA